MFAVLSYLLSSEPSCLYSVQQAFDVSLHARTGHMQIGYPPLCCEVARLVQVSAVLWDTASGICRSLLQVHGQISHGNVFLSRQPSGALVGRLCESHRTGENTLLPRAAGSVFSACRFLIACLFIAQQRSRLCLGLQTIVHLWVLSSAKNPADMQIHCSVLL